MMKNYDQSVEINHNPKWSYILDHLYGILLIGGSGSRKTNVLINLIRCQEPDIEKNDLYVKDSFESKYQLLIYGRKIVGIKNLNPKEFIDYSQAIDDVYDNLEDYNSTKKTRVLIVFHDMIADMKSNKILNPIVIELFLRRRKLYISLAFISQSCFKMPKTIRQNARRFFVTKIPNKRELQQIASNHLS